MCMITLYTPQFISCRLILNTFLHTVKQTISAYNLIIIRKIKYMYDQNRYA